MLCLACASDLIPSQNIFTTKCCNRPICPRCLSSNYRLSFYNPCIACSLQPSNAENDVFIVGEDDQDHPPAYHILSPDVTNHTHINPLPLTHYIQSNDTLLGIAFKYNIDGRLLCRLNNLPYSTLSTTPHLLYTREFIVLPDSIRLPSSSRNHPPNNTNKSKSKFKSITNEQDSQVVDAYIAVAISEIQTLEGLGAGEVLFDVDDDVDEKIDEKLIIRHHPNGQDDLTTTRAIEKYMDDLKWESRHPLPSSSSSYPYPARSLNRYHEK